MQGPMGGTAEIVIPTGRTGFCCIVPCALMAVLDAGALAAALLLVRHLARRAMATRAPVDTLCSAGRE